MAAVLALAAGALDGRGQELPPGRYALTFAAAPAAVRVSPDGREVLVEFPGPLADGEADRAAHALGPLLEGYAEGYGAVRYRLTTPAAARLADRRTVEIVARAESEPSLDDQRRLALLDARTEARNGNVPGARTRLQAISAERPGDMEPLLALAEIETGAGRWQHALGLYDGVRRLFPEAADITRDRTSLATRHAPSVRLDGSATFGPGGERSQTAILTADLPLGERWRASVSLQSVHDEIRNLRRTGSATVADYDETKLLAGLALAYNWNSSATTRPTTRIDLFAAPKTLGASLKHDFTTAWGATTLGLLYHQPYWGTVMSFAANARRDQLGFAQTVTLPDQWQLQFGAGLIRYGIPANDSVASGPSALAGLSRGLPERWLPWDGMQLRLGYRLEAEYLSAATTGRTAAGQLPLLDVRAREIHSLYTETAVPVGPGTATALAGYAYDRLGGGGPQLSLRFTGGADDDRLAFSAEAGIEPSLDIKPRTLFHVGGSLVWRFGGG